MKLHVRTSRPVSIITMIVSAFLVIFGLGFMVLVGGVLSENDAPPLVRAGFYLFMVVWIGAAIATAVFHLRNARQGMGGELLELEGDAGDAAGSISPGPMQRLRTLDRLKKDGLISDEEFRHKRDEIMSERW